MEGLSHYNPEDDAGLKHLARLEAQRTGEKIVEPQKSGTKDPGKESAAYRAAMLDRLEDERENAGAYAKDALPAETRMEMLARLEAEREADNDSGKTNRKAA